MMERLLLSLIAGLGGQLAAFGEPSDQARTSAAFSRKSILPLVAEPGKERRIFSSFKAGERATWNPEFWGAPLGFKAYTGVGWNKPQAGILVTPEHVVGAAHYGVNASGVDFYGLDGQHLGNRKPARDEAGTIIASRLKRDVIVIRLSAPAPEGAAIVKLPDPKGHSQRLKWNSLAPGERPLLVATDWRNPKPTAPAKAGEEPRKQKWRITRSAHPVLLRSINEQAGILQWSLGAANDPAVDTSYHETVNKGDSSHPLFWVTPSGLVLASHFTGITAGPDYGNPDLQKELQQAIDELGGSEARRLSFAPVP